MSLNLLRNLLKNRKPRRRDDQNTPALGLVERLEDRAMLAAVFINEIHYDNLDTDTGEFIEIAGPAGTDVNGWTLVLYNGSNNGTYTPTQTLSGTIPNEGGTGFGTIAVFYPSNGLQNGAPDGMALVDNLGNVVEFLSYEGTITASGGPADGMTSIDIGVSQTNSTPIGETLQRIGTGTVSTDFTWTGPVDDSPGAINAGQTFNGGGTPDTTPPALAADPFDPDDDGTNVPVGSNLNVRFNESIQLASSGTITIFRGSDNSVLAQYDLATSTGTLAVSVSGDTLTINPDSNLPADTAVYVQISAGAVQDTSGNNFAGITDTTTWNFTTAATAPTSTIVINEVDSDTESTDILEFVELYDGGVGNTSLDGLVLVFFNGSNDTSYFALDLTGFSTNAQGFFVAGNADVANVQSVFPSNGLQNGADAVALYSGSAGDFPTGTAVTNVNLIDAVVYDTDDADDSGLLDVLTPGQPQINENENGNKDFESIARVPDGGTAGNTSTYVVQAPTPGASNGVATAGPEINVQGNSVTIVDGDTTPSTTDGTDFGSTATSGGMVTRTFTIQNTGTASLDVTGITISGATSDFTVANFTAGSVAASGSITFDVIFDPTVDGVRTATVNIASDDSDESDYDFAITGTGTTTATGPNVVISEIMYNPSSADGDSPNAEWIEIVNIGTVAADIGGWFFSDEDGDWGAIEAGTMLAPGQVAVVYDTAFTDAGTFRFQWQIPDEALVIGVAWGNLSNSPSESNEVLVLLDGSLNIMDTANYDDEGDWPVDNGTGSIYLIDLESDNNVGTNWAISTIGVNDARSPGGDPYSPSDVGTPGTVPGANDSTPPELAADPFTPADNLTGVSVDTSLTINFNETVQAGSGNIVIRNLDTNSVIETIPVGSGQVSIIGPTVTITPSSPLPLDTNISIQIASGVFEDTSGNAFAGFTDDTTWNFATAASTAAPSVIITEIMYNPAGSGDGSSPFSEWVEIVNTGSEAADISGWVLDDEDAGTWGAFAVGTILNPGQVAVIFDTLIVDGDASAFRAAWSIPAEALVLGVTWGSLANGATDTNEVLVLRNGSGEIVDTANYEAGTNDWPASTNGLSIYVTSLGVDNNIGANWALSALGVNGGRNPVSLFDTGNVGSPGTVPGVTDNTPPELSANPFTPADNLTGVSVDTLLVINFTEPVQAGTGNIVIRNLDTNTVIETIAVGSGQVSIAGATVTITPSSPLPLNTDISIQVASGAFEDTSGNVFAGFTDDTTWNFTTAASTAAPSIVISEIMYNPAGEDGGSPVDEWVEIVNTGSEAVDISGWFLDDEDSGTWGAIPVGTILNPGQVAVIFDTLNGSESDFRADWSIPAEALVFGVTWGSLANSASDTNEVLVLRDSSGEIADTANYEAGTNGWPASTNGVSIFLTDLDADNNVGSNWTLSVSGDSGVVNPQGTLVSPLDAGSPGRIPGVPVVDTTPPGLSIVDPFSPADDATGIGTAVNLTVTFNENVQAGTGTITIRNADTNAVIETFTLNPSGPNTGVTFSGNTVTIDPQTDLPASTNVAVQITSGAITDTSGNSFAGISNNTTWNFTTGATAAGAVWIINEILADPDATNGDANGDGIVNTSEDEFVEIVNATGVAVDISGWTVSDGASLRHTFDPGTVIPHLGSIVIFGGGTPTGDFGGSAVVVTNAGVSTLFGLNNGGDTVTLADASGNVMASATYGAEGGNNQSLTLSPDLTGSFAEHTTVSSASFSPGTQADGTPFPGNVTTGDTTAPTLTSIARQTPSQELTNSASVTFQLIFDESVTGVDAADFVATGGGTIGNVSGSGTTYTVTVIGLGSVNGTVGLALNSPTITDAANNSLTNLTPGSNQTYTLDTLAPAVVSLSPLDNATEVATGTTLTITFDDAVVKGSGSIQIVDLNNGNNVIDTIDVSSTQVSVSGNTVTITPTSALPLNASLAVQVAGSAFTDSLGNAFAGISGTTAWNFTTTATDTVAPTVLSLTPADNATGVAVNSPLTIQFSETVTKGSGSIVIRNTSTNAVVETISVSSSQVVVSGSSVTITPSVALPSDASLAVRISAGAFVDAASNAFAGIANDTTWNFSTVGPASVVLSSSVGSETLGPFTVTASFSQAVTGFTSTDVSVTNGTVSNFTTVNAQTFTFVVTPNSNVAGTIISVSVPAGAAQSGSVDTLASNVVSTTVGVSPSPTQSTIVVTAQATGGGTLLVRDAQTGELRYTLTPFTSQLSIPSLFFPSVRPSTSGLDVALADLNADGVDDIVVGAGRGHASQIVIYDGLSGTELRRITVFPGSNRFGVNVALADVNFDGVADIVAATASGASQVRILNGAQLISTGAVVELANFSPYPGFGGGVDVAATDMNGDGYAEVITGAQAGGGPHVKVFSGVDLGQLGRTVELASFFAYDAAFGGGVNVAVGDINGDSTPDVITGAGAGGGPHVRVFSGASLLSGGLGQVASFFAYDSRFTGGVDVGAGDVNGDGKEDVFTAAGPGGGPHVKVFSGDAFVQSGTALELDSYFAFAPSFTGGVRLAAGNGGSALTASSLGSAGVGSTVSTSTLAATTYAAQDAWRTAGLSAAGLAKLNAANISVTDLPGRLVGLAVGDSVYIDVDAAGHGWNSSNDSDSDAERLDLLTAISHEFGHLLGLDDSVDDADSVMAALLSPGDRRLPTADDLEDAFVRWGQN
jgi:methionine-rich copper-binding protein CopC